MATPWRLTASLPPHLRANLYQALAEVLAEPPDWLTEAGHNWPLYAAARPLAAASAGMTAAVAALAAVPAEALLARRARYTALFAGPGRPRFWLYESACRAGRWLGPEAAAVARFYRAGGWQTAGAELADHAALELAFLAALAESQMVEAQGGHAWAELERSFLEVHAGCWLPQLGQALAACGDEVYAPIGRLLGECLGEAPRPAPSLSRRLKWPEVAGAECTLCGFCAQVCPTGALAIHETTNETALLLSGMACLSCGKCQRVCQTRALRLREGAIDAAAAEHRILRRAARAACAGCGRPLASQAELDRVAALIGHVPWLAYCPDCRVGRAWA